MIKAECLFHESDIVGLEVTGHAGYDETGKDLICAGVSCIVFGLMNALDVYGDKVVIYQGDNDIKITIEDVRYDIIQNYMQLAMIQLETIAESYPEYMKLERRES